MKHRLAWDVPGQLDLQGKPIDGSIWVEDTHEARYNLEVARHAGDATYGDGTHRIEERDLDLS